MRIGTNRVGPRALEIYIEIGKHSVPLSPARAREVANDLRTLADRVEAEKKNTA